MNMKSTNYFMIYGKPSLEIKNYLEDFPFKHYVRIKIFSIIISTKRMFSPCKYIKTILRA